MKRSWPWSATMPAAGTAWAVRETVAAVLMGLVLTAPGVAGEPPKAPIAPKLAEAARRGWFRARIVAGRIVFGGTQLGSISELNESGDRSERLSIRLAGQALAATYEMSGAGESLRIEVSGGNQLHICRTPKGDSTLVPLEFSQPAEGPLQLTLGPTEDQRVFQAASLWHLLVMQPEACREHLAPILDLMDEPWDLGKTAEDVEAALLRDAGGPLPDPRRWAELVEQLGDERFSRREAADRELRAFGRIVYTYLQELDPTRLDAEQHYRVRRILTRLSAGMQSDTPPQIAAWLAGDTAVWLALLSRREEPVRRLAARRLEALLGESIPFDPAAEATTRASQIEQLRTRLQGQ